MALSGTLRSLNVARATPVVDQRPQGDDGDRQARGRRARSPSCRSASRATSRPTSSVHGGPSKAVYAYPSEHYAFWQTVRAQAGVSLWDDALPPGSLGENLSLEGLVESRALDRRRAALSALRPRRERAALSLLQVQRRDGLQARAQADGRKAPGAASIWRCASPARSRPGESFTLVPGPREVGIVELFRARMSRAGLMLAYRHAFHAGNHADVLKHLVLMLVLEHLNAKPKAYRFVDTHAGAGGYSLEGRYAQKNGEFERGVGRLWTRDDLPRRSPTTSRWCASSIPTACSRSTPARRRWRRCCCARRTSCARSSSIRPSRRSCARPSARTAARRSTTATASRACARRCRRRRAAPPC